MNSCIFSWRDNPSTSVLEKMSAVIPLSFIICIPNTKASFLSSCSMKPFIKSTNPESFVIVPLLRDTLYFTGEEITFHRLTLCKRAASITF